MTGLTMLFFSGMWKTFGYWLEAIQVKPGLQSMIMMLQVPELWMPARESCTEWVDQSDSTAERTVRHATTGLRFWPDEFQSCFCPVVPHGASMPPFWDSNVYSVLLYVGGM